MYFRSKTILAALLAMTPFFATAATVDLNGKIYQTVTVDTIDGYQGTSSPQRVFNYFNISAKLGESTTQSYAYDLGETYESLEQQALLGTLTNFSVWNVDSTDVEANNYMNTGFTLSNAQTIVVGNHAHRVFDLTFAPTAATVVEDDDGNLSRNFIRPDGSSLFPVGTSSAAVNISGIYAYYDVIDKPSGPAIAYRDQYGGTDLIALVGIVLPADAITSVPLPGSAAFLALGLLGLGAARRRKT